MNVRLEMEIAGAEALRQWMRVWNPERASAWADAAAKVYAAMEEARKKHEQQA